MCQLHTVTQVVLGESGKGIKGGGHRRKLLVRCQIVDNERIGGTFCDDALYKLTFTMNR